MTDYLIYILLYFIINCSMFLLMARNQNRRKILKRNPWCVYLLVIMIFPAIIIYAIFDGSKR